MITQNDTRNIEYLIGWLKKYVWNSYFLSKVLFPQKYFEPLVSVAVAVA